MMRTLTFFVASLILAICGALPVLPEEDSDEFFAQVPVDLKNSSSHHKDLYVIRTIVYEVGILTDATNDTDNSTETNEEIDLTFFNPTKHGGKVDLNNIPVPIQTNVSGVSITGVLPLDFGSFDIPEEGKTAKLNNTIFPNALISVKHNVSTTNVLKGEELLKNLSPILGLQSIGNITNKSIN